MRLKFTSIDNNTRVFKKYIDLKGEIILICASDNVWQVWENMLKAYNDEDLIDLDTPFIMDKLHQAFQPSSINGFSVCML